MKEAQFHELIQGFDPFFVMFDMISEIIGRHVPIEAYVDSKPVLGVIFKDARTAARRLQIDVTALRESYKKWEWDRIGWITGPVNAADGLPNINAENSSFLSIIMTIHISPKPISWARMSRENKKRECSSITTKGRELHEPKKARVRVKNEVIAIATCQIVTERALKEIV